MYTKGSNGERQEVRLDFGSTPHVQFSMDNNKAQPSMIKENYEKSEGSNKAMLYTALVIGLIVVAGSGYMIYTNYEKPKKTTTKFGYPL